MAPFELQLEGMPRFIINEAEGEAYVRTSDALGNDIATWVPRGQRQAAAQALAGDDHRVVPIDEYSGEELDAARAEIDRLRDQVGGIAPYLLLDLWQALGGDPADFDDWHARHGSADTWGQLLHIVRRTFRPVCGKPVDGEYCVLTAPNHESDMHICHGPSDVGKDELPPIPPAQAGVTHSIVRGRCPACDRGGLMVGAEGHVTCSHFDCPSPETVDEMLRMTDQECAAVTARAKAEALREAADAYSDYDGGDDERVVRLWLRRRADALEQPEPDPQKVDAMREAIREGYTDTAAVPVPDAGDDTLRHELACAVDEHRLTTPVQCLCKWRETDSDTDTWAEHTADALLPRIRAHTERAVEQARADERERVTTVTGMANEAGARILDERNAALAATERAKAVWRKHTDSHGPAPSLCICIACDMADALDGSETP